MVPEFINGDIAERTIGASTVRFLGVEHDAPLKNYPLNLIRELVRSDCSRLVVEYFLPELKQNVFNFLFGSKEENYPDGTGIIRFSREVNRIAKEEQKNILVMDPANNFWYQFLFQYAPIALILAGYAGLVYSFGKHELADQRSQIEKISRREFLRFGSSLMGLIGLETVSWRLQDFPLTEGFNGAYRGDYSFNLRDMRWVTVAEGLNQYCQENPNETLLALYPPKHVEGILHYLDHPDKKRWKYRFYSKILGLTKEIREYAFLDEQWKPAKHSYKIESNPIV